MAHRLAQPGQQLNAVGVAPMSATLRYRCDCGDRELLTLSVVFDATTDEQRFLWTMQMLWRDMQTEVRQHLKDQPGVDLDALRVLQHG